MENKINKKFKIKRLVNENILKRNIKNRNMDDPKTLLSNHSVEIKNYLKKFKKLKNSKIKKYSRNSAAFFLTGYQISFAGNSAVELSKVVQ